MKIVLLMDNRADENWGSQATTTVLARLLEEMHPGAEVVGVRRSAARPRSGFARRLVERVAPGIAIRDAWGTAAGRWCARQLVGSWIHVLKDADLVVTNGEGTLHSQKQTLRWLPALGYVAATLDAPLWVVNTTIEVETPSHWGLFSHVLQKANRVVVREPKSLDVAKGLGVEPIAGMDCALLADGAADSEVVAFLGSRAIGEDYAVMTGSAVVERWSHSAQVGIARELLASGLDVLYLASTDEDRRNHIRSFAGLPVHLITNDDVDFRQVVGLIRRAKLFVGGRFHLILFAAKEGTPFVAVPSNTHKTIGMVQLLGAESQLIAMQDEEGQLAAIRAVLASSCARGVEIQQRAENLARLVLRNAREEEGERVSGYPPSPLHTTRL